MRLFNSKIRLTKQAPSDPHHPLLFQKTVP